MSKEGISLENFEKHKVSNKDTLKWGDLKQGEIYEVNDVEILKTRYGQVCIITLKNGSRHFAPSSLCRTLEIVDPDGKRFPYFIRSLAKKRSKESYWDFSLKLSNSCL